MAYRNKAQETLTYIDAVRGTTVPELLYDLLEIKSPSKKEEPIRDLIKQYLTEHAPDVDIIEDEKGNLSLIVSKKDGTHDNIIFTAHMDTVHNKEGKIQLKVTSGPNEIDKGYLVAFETKESTKFSQETKKMEPVTSYGRCILGADDKAGIYLLTEMIKAGISGYYCFFVQEEIGGLGSKYWAENNKAMLKNIDHVISFDRAGTADIINSQRGGNCASPEFVTELGTRLATVMEDKLKIKMNFKANTGSFTDSASFMKEVAECTNISVGYYSQHTPSEKQDLYFLQWLRVAITHMDWTGLPAKRDPKYVAPVSRYGSYNGGYGGFGSSFFTKKFRTSAIWNPAVIIADPISRVSGIAHYINLASDEGTEYAAAKRIAEGLEREGKTMAAFISMAKLFKSLDTTKLDPAQKLMYAAAEFDAEVAQKAIFPPEKALNLVITKDKLNYNTATRTATIGGKRTVLYSKKKNPMSATHVKTLAENTELYVKLSTGVFQLVHTITKAESINAKNLQ